MGIELIGTSLSLVGIILTLNIIYLRLTKGSFNKINWYTISSIYLALIILVSSTIIAVNLTSSNTKIQQEAQILSFDKTEFLNVGSLFCKSDKHIRLVKTDILDCHLTINNTKKELGLIKNINITDENLNPIFYPIPFWENDQGISVKFKYELPDSDTNKIVIAATNNDSITKTTYTTIQLVSFSEEDRIRREIEAQIYSVLVFSITAAIWGVSTGINNLRQIIKRTGEGK